MKESEIWIIVITAIQAIATFAAVVVALWQTKYNNRKKLKISAYDGTATNIDNGLSEDMLIVNIVNVGNRNVIIDGWGIKLHKKRLLFVGTSQIFPQNIPVENSKILSCSLIELRKRFEKENYIKNKNKKITVFIYDSTGKEYTVKTKKTFAQIFA